MKTYALKGSGPRAAAVDHAKELNPEQLEVVLRGDGPCLVLAGAGSGKTRTIVYRVAHLLERGVPAERILLLTFTNKAAREMRERVAALLGADPRGMWSGTFHHVCHRILRESSEAAGLKPGFTILDAEDSRDLMKACVRDCGIDATARRFPSPAVLLAVHSYARNARRSLGSALESKWPNFLEIENEIGRVLDRYDARKRGANSVDFDDLLLLVRRLLLENAERRARYARRFRYVLVDEYQDTNQVQAEIVRLLASEHGNVLVVGDDAQSIYSFRGADIGNILGFPELFPGAKTFRLETNYRSTPEILDLANDVISRNAKRFEKTLRAVRPSFAPPQKVIAVSAAQEAEFVAQRVLELRDEGVPLSEMAVLFRAAFHSQALEFELAKRDIPYDYRGGKKFFDRAHVKDTLAFLKLLVNKDDLVAWMRVLSLQVGIGAVSAGKLYERARTAAALEDLDEATAAGLGARVAKGWSGFLSVLRAMLKDGGSPGAAIQAVLASEYARYLEAQYPNWRDRVEDLRELSHFAGRYGDTASFLADIALDDGLAPSGDEAARRDDEDRLVLSTVHQAKGLEWDAVFLLHLTQGQFPNRRAALDEGGLEEERRLFYVAVTRARRELYLCHPVAVGYDGSDFGAPSEFLEELSPRLVEEVMLEEPWNDLPDVDLDDDASPREKGKYLVDLDEL